MSSKLQKRFVFFAALFLALAVRPFAQTTNTNLEDRVNKLEGNIDRILQILQQGQQGSSAPNAAGSTAGPTPTPAAATTQQSGPQLKTAPGAALDVWVLRPDFTGSSPEGSPIGRFIDKGEYFSLANFTQERGFESYQTSRVALRWAGYFKAEEAGLHLFSIEMKKSKESAGNWGRSSTPSSGAWVVELSLNGGSILRESLAVVTDGEFFQVATAEADLQPGLYSLTLLTFISPDSSPARPAQWNYQPFRIAMKVKGPKDNFPRAITADDIFHKIE